MTAFATQETISQTISEKVEVDPLKFWMEDFIVSPLAQQLERVETSTRVSVTYSREGSENLKALSDAVSSLGTQISQLQKMVSEGLRRSSSMTSSDMDSEEPENAASPLMDYEYSCHAIIGIEETFVKDMCVYCGKYFTAGPQTPVDWRIRGLHLAVEHNLSDCNSDISYPTQSECRQHLEKFYHALYIYEEDILFFRRARGTQHVSRDRDSFSTGREILDGQNGLRDLMSEPSCLSELEMDLRSCLHHLEQADVESTASSLSDLRSSTLELF
jgi:hypothetical protein